MVLPKCFLLDKTSHGYIYYYLFDLFIYFYKLLRFLKTVAVKRIRLPFSKSGSRVDIRHWSLVKIVDVASVPFRNEIAFLHQHFKLIPTSGFRHSHFRMDSFWRKLQIVAVPVSGEIEVEAQGGCIKISIRIV